MSIENYDYGSINKDAAYALELPGFLKLLEELNGDILHGTLKTDQHYSDEFDSYCSPDDSSIYMPIYVDLADNIKTNLSAVTYPNTYARISCYLKVVSVFQYIYSLSSETDIFNILVNASNTSQSLNEQDILFKSSDITKDLYKMSANKVDSINVSVALSQLYQFSQTYGNNVTNLITALVATGNYYSNDYIENYLINVCDDTIASLSSLATVLDSLTSCSKTTCFLGLYQKIANNSNDALSKLYTAVAVDLNIATRLNYSPVLIQKLIQILGLIEAVYTIINLLIIDNNLINLVYQDVNLDAVNSALGRINDTLISNSSTTEADLLLQQITYSKSDQLGDDQLIDKITEATHQVIYNLKPDVLNNTSVTNSVNTFLGIANNQYTYLDGKHTGAINTRTSIETAMSSINGHIQSGGLNFNFMSILSLIVLELQAILDLINKFICAIFKLLCALKKLITGGINMLLSLIGSPGSLVDACNSAIQACITSAKNIVYPRIQGVVQPYLGSQFTIAQNANVAAVTASLGSTIGAKVQAAYASISVDSLMNTLNLRNAIDTYATTALATLTDQVKALLDPKSCVSSGFSFKLPGINFPSLSLPNINLNLPQFQAKPFRC
ncbi:hypothetical protein [Ralstonia phage RP13]|nr:hypothetical protein [Ralstonia phage RP13]